VAATGGSAENATPPPARQDRSSAAVTIRDVAREAGVATSTVSRAFTAPQRVNERTRRHVLAVADRLDYRPNPLARALPSGRTTTLGLLVPDITNPFFSRVIRGAERQANAAGYTLILTDTEESSDVEDRSIQRLRSVTDGFVLAASRLSEGGVREIAANNVVALINRQAEGVPSVVVDTSDSTHQIVDHLASLGHRSIAYLSGPRASWPNRQRWAALSRAAEELDIAATQLGPFSPELAAGAAAADAAIRQGATAVVAYNALLAIGTLRRFAERGKRVPEDISVVGYDDIFGTDFCSPPLTTVAAPVEDAGRRAIDLLLGQLNARDGHDYRHNVVLPTYLRIRESTGQAPQ
jgi:DNA-binding LacI/PurR family transcriptional regulator